MLWPNRGASVHPPRAAKRPPMSPFEPRNPDFAAVVQGFFHGALIGAMLDCAGGYAAYSLMPAGSDVLTTEYKINFLAAAQGERLIARGRVIQPGQRITVATAEAFCLRDGREHLCAVLLQSLIQVPAPAP